MSETYITYGVIAELKNPITEELYDDCQQIFWENDEKSIGITYNGKFVYSKIFSSESWDFSFVVFDQDKISECVDSFLEEIKKYGFEIKGEIKPYVQQYHSSSDATIDMIEKI